MSRFHRESLLIGSIFVVTSPPSKSCFCFRIFKLLFSYVDDHLPPIGGSGNNVQIDETVVGKKKYNRGEQRTQNWYFGGIEQRLVKDKDGNESFEVGLAFAHYVDNRRTAALLPIIKKRIAPG